jgi:hypothetical protein
VLQPVELLHRLLPCAFGIIISIKKFPNQLVSTLIKNLFEIMLRNRAFHHSSHVLPKSNFRLFLSKKFFFFFFTKSFHWKNFLTQSQNELTNSSPRGKGKKKKKNELGNLNFFSVKHTFIDPSNSRSNTP